MTRRLALLLLLLPFHLCMTAQTKFTDRLQQGIPGQGKVTIFQSKAIEDLVNNMMASSSTKPGEVIQPGTENEVVQIPSADQRPKVQMNGYRIQVYSGGNSREAKNEATVIGRRVRSMFNTLSVYTFFSSPHWTCRVGDFKTYEEANEVFRQLKENGNFQEAVIVRSKILTAY